jgi:hypothetical protein
MDPAISANAAAKRDRVESIYVPAGGTPVKVVAGGVGKFPDSPRSSP